jgi:hypothetical protein
MKKQEVEIIVERSKPDIKVILTISLNDMLEAILQKLDIYDEETRFILTHAERIKIKVKEVEEE